MIEFYVRIVGVGFPKGSIIFLNSDILGKLVGHKFYIYIYLLEYYRKHGS
jgi:hypothetical protein